MVLALIFIGLGFWLGWKRAEKRGGKRSDKIQMGFAHAIPLGVLGFTLSILTVNLGF
ncbi:MAG: hypothetical protein AAF577_06820 [Pseudomonadota bacterium]